jgi:wyosine [tRNA(Phe)-imidazoG37] synthetase (radical SAM superfamily)
MRVYGPVPSRRFGLSLGVDVLPMKACTFDCIYCQLGATDTTTADRSTFYSLDEIIADVEEALSEGPAPDVVTLAGSGEPTLYRPLGELLDRLKALAKIPILLITNSSMLWKAEVREAVKKADILAPSLDAFDDESFQRINRPHGSITFERLFSGLKQATHEHPGEVHLEVMLIDRVNDDEASLQAIAGKIAELRVDRIDINTPVRPPMPKRGALPCRPEVLERATAIFGPRAHPIGDFRDAAKAPRERRAFSDRDKDIREMLLRRPCTLDDIADAFAIPREEALRSLERLMDGGFVEPRKTGCATYFHVPSPRPTIGLGDGNS